MSVALRDRIEAGLARPVAEPVRAFAAHIAGLDDALAMLFYGSNLRTGSLDGVLDYYVLTVGKPERGIWPTVRYHEWDGGDGILRAKVATMTLATFRKAATGALTDTTIWARFVQPSALVWRRDDEAAARVADAMAAAARTAARLAIALGPDRGLADDYWRALFRATYRAELRVEPPGREDSILAAHRDHFSGLLGAALGATGIPYRQEGSTIAPSLDENERRRILAWWKPRRRLGKALNTARLVRAAGTFDGAARYAAWKVERHTGVAIEVTPWRERHPVLAAPGVLWRVWRQRNAAR